MILDYSIEYDDTFSNFKGQNVLRITNGPMWIILNTNKAKEYLKKNYEYYDDSFGLGIYKFEHDEAMKIRNILQKEKSLTGIYGGFYYDRFITKMNEITNDNK